MMKKILVFVLIISVLLLSSCSAKEAVNISPEKDIKTQSIKDEPQSPQTIITVNAQTAKMSFLGYNNEEVSQKNKNYTIDKISAFEKYSKRDVKSKDFNILGIEYKDVTYYQSEKNQYTGEDYDIYKNEAVRININSAGVIDFFLPNKAISLFSDESKHSEELAKKYLNIIMPNYKYDTVRIDEIESLNVYVFSKSIDGVRTSDSVEIALNSEGCLAWYIIYDVGKYNNVKIENLNINEFLQRVDEYAKDTYGGNMIKCEIFDNGPFLSIFTGNKIELTIPVAITIKDSTGLEYSFAEDVIFELN